MKYLLYFKTDTEDILFIAKPVTTLTPFVEQITEHENMAERYPTF